MGNRGNSEPNFHKVYHAVYRERYQELVGKEILKSERKLVTNECFWKCYSSKFYFSELGLHGSYELVFCHRKAISKITRAVSEVVR